MSRHDEVEQWLTGAHEIVARDQEPDICTGVHCGRTSFALRAPWRQITLGAPSMQSL